MKLIAILLFAFSFTQCKSLQLDKTPPFKVTKATYKNWVGGQPGISGLNVFIYYTAEKEISFDSIYYKNRVVKVEMNNVKGNKFLAGRFNSSRVNSKKDLVLHKDAKKEFGNQLPKKEHSFDLKENEAIVSYKVENKLKYFKISNLKEEETLFYPSMERK